MKKLITAAFMLATTSALADYNTVTHFTWDTDSNGNVGCYASNSGGAVNGGEQPSSNECCAN